MSIVNKLSSQTGDKTQNSNIEVAIECINAPNLLQDIANSLTSKDAKLVGDCAEVFTKVAEEHPELVAPYISNISTLIEHKATRIRWEAVHTLSYIAVSAKDSISQLLPKLEGLIKNDSSTIVRDYAVDAIGNYASIGENEALVVYPILTNALTIWDGKHAGQALRGLINVAKSCPNLADELHGIGNEYSTHSKGVISKSAKALMKASFQDLIQK